MNALSWSDPDVSQQFFQGEQPAFIVAPGGMLRVFLLSCGDGVYELFLKSRPFVIALFSQAYGNGKGTPFPIVMEYHFPTLAGQGRAAGHLGNLFHGLTLSRHLCNQNLGDTDHGVPGNQSREFCFTHILRTCGTFRQHQITDLGTAVPDTDLDLIVEFRAELL